MHDTCYWMFTRRTEVFLVECNGTVIKCEFDDVKKKGYKFCPYCGKPILANPEAV